MGWDGIGSDRIGSDRIGSDRIGSDRIGSDRIGSVKAPFVGSVTQNQPGIISISRTLIVHHP